ncbi:hypothetical protein [Tenacibaculum mesophilum]|uniref:hypothetical protein n=1 Tax=Tenacibaculum mesophilum TaxID=104268 RepID=UPI003F609418
MANIKVTNKKLENIISELNQNNKKEEALFGFYHQDGDEYNTCIKANKQGLELFALELLKARNEIENQSFENGEVEYLEIDIDWTDPNADFYFNNIELTNKLKTEKEPIPEYKESWKDKLYGYLIFGIIIGLIILLIVGFITTLSWIFEK